MKFLLDENVSPRLAEVLAATFPGSVHVRELGLRGASDARIWVHARAAEFTILSKDTDFRDRAFVEGSPPQVVWLDVGNAGTREIASLLERERDRIQRFSLQRVASLLILSLGPAAV